MTPVISSRPTTKGEDTRSQILAAAVEHASASGFESLTIGSLAEKTGMSKSGLFAHFGSKQELQIAALDEAARQFTEAVFMPAMKVPRGLKRLRAIFENWITWPTRGGLPGGCPIDAASREYHHQPGAMRDAVVDRQKQLDRELAKAVQMAVDSGELLPETDPRQFAFDMLGIVLVFYRTELLLGAGESIHRARKSFERLVSEHTR
ncbi:MAG TPA: TetR/AcrR family transcriptional regulator [Usitatibacter sp.]|nr:TetR/AcrR family transcriptional regulator [Usitatibacter sp.]